MKIVHRGTNAMDGGWDPWCATFFREDNPGRTQQRDEPPELNVGEIRCPRCDDVYRATRSKEPPTERYKAYPPPCTPGPVYDTCAV